MSNTISKQQRKQRKEKSLKRKEKEEQDRNKRLADNRNRRGNPQKFTIKGPVFFGGIDEEDRGMKLEEIDPPLETGEKIKIVEIEPILIALILLSYKKSPIYNNDMFAKDIIKSLFDKNYLSQQRTYSNEESYTIINITIDGWKYINNIIINLLNYV